MNDDVPGSSSLAASSSSSFFSAYLVRAADPAPRPGPDESGSNDCRWEDHPHDSPD